MNETISTTRENVSALIPMSKKDWGLLALSLIPAGLFAFGDMVPNDAWLRIYTSLFHLSVLLLACYAAGKRKPNRTSAFLFLSSAALIGLGFIHHDLFLCCTNCFIIPMLTALAMMHACSISRRSPLSAAGVWEVVVRSLRGLFDSIPLPFAKLFTRSEDHTENLALTLFSLCVCIPILMLVLILLSSADAVFGNQFGNLVRAVEYILSSPSAFRIPLMLVSALMIFSWMFTLRKPAWEMANAEPITIPPIFCGMLLPMLNIIYALFVYIQFSNLFGGAETAAMTGGYAEYARTGFFQLAAVSTINLGILAVSLRNKRNRWIVTMSLLLIVSTAVILVSALWRMRLYIGEYGLSVLRVMTLWGMLTIAILLVISTISIFVNNFPTFSVSFICIIVLWVGLNCIDIDRIIAEHNVFHYLSGELQEIDWEYLQSLSPSAQSVLDQLEQ